VPFNLIAVGEIGGERKGILLTNLLCGIFLFFVSVLRITWRSGRGTASGSSNANGNTIYRIQLTDMFWGGLGYPNSVWDLGTPVTRNGWPTLKNVGGQQ